MFGFLRDAASVTLDKWCEPPGGLPRWLRDKESACNAGDLASIPGLGRSPGEKIGYPLEYSA